MQVNNFSTTKTICFNGKKNDKESIQMNLNTFINSSDEDLYMIAKSQHDKKHKNDTVKFIGACIGVDAISSMILKSQVIKTTENEIQVLKAPLSSKIGAGLKTLKGWGIGFAAVGVFMGVKKLFLDKNEKFKEFEQNNPVLSLVTEIGALLLGHKGISLACSKMGLKEKLLSKMTPLTTKLKNISNKIDNSKISTFIMNRGEELAKTINTKAPALGNIGKILLANSVFIMLLGGIFKMNKNNKELQNNYETLKSAQEQIKNSYN